jgi:hypothetical protein
MERIFASGHAIYSGARSSPFRKIQGDALELNAAFCREELRLARVREHLTS